jgi:hypothetical protein
MAAKKSKRVDPIKQRERRAKIAAGVGGVLFLLLAAYEVPTVLKLMNQKPPPGTQFSDAVKTNPDGSIPLPSVATPTASANGDLADSDVPPSTGTGQLVSFSMFQTKNPFVPQVSVSDEGPTPSTSSTGSSGTTTTTTTTTTPTSTNPLGSGLPGGLPTTTTPGGVVPANGSTSTSTTTTTAAPAPQVAISVNGTVSRVATNDSFPTGAPVFRLISYGAGTAQIGIVGGSYSDGNQTLTLQQGKPITLENQSTGTKYKVELLSTP